MMSLSHRVRDGVDRLMYAPRWVWGLAIALLASVLLLVNLGNHYLWQDEAQTALIARTILDRGLPYGTDGLNFFSQELGAEYGEGYLWKWHTWLSFYATAASFQLFDTTTFAARLPFALFGMASLVLVFLFCDRQWGRRAALVAAVLALTCIPFFLLSRQCRYYSAAAFFSLLALHYYLEMLRSRRRAWLYFALAATGLFHVHYVYFATLIAAIGVHAVVFGRQHWRPIAAGSLGALLINVPWIVWLSSMRYGDQYGGVVSSWRAALSKLGAFVVQLDHVQSFYAVLGALVLWAAAAFYGKAMRPRLPAQNSEVSTPSALLLLALFVAINLGALAVSSPAAFFRYLAPVIPVWLILVAALLASMSGPARWAVPLLLALAIGRQPVADYLYELAHDYDGPIEGIVRFLGQRASATDVVAITYGDMPLKFYTRLRVVGGLTGEDLSPALNARWVIIRHHVISDKDMAVRDYLTSRLLAEQFRIHRLAFPDLPFENRESPHEHQYRTVEGYFPVMVLERLR